MKTRNLLITIITVVFVCSLSLAADETKETAASSAPAKLTNTALLTLFDRNVDLSAFNPQMSLERALEILRHSTTPNINIVVLWNQLEQVDISRGNPIHMDAISGVPLKTALELLIQSISGTDSGVTYWIKDGLITIGLERYKTTEMVTQIYKIDDLTSSPSTAGGMAMGGMGGYGGGMGGYGGGMGGYGTGGAGLGGYGTGGGYGTNYSSNMGYNNYGTGNRAGYYYNSANNSTAAAKRNTTANIPAANYSMGSSRGYGGGYGGGMSGYGGMGGYGGGGMGGYGGGGMGGYGGGGMGGYGGGGMGGYGGGGMGGYGGGMRGGMGGYGGGMGMTDNPAMRMQRQYELQGLIKRTIQPETWNP